MADYEGKKFISTLNVVIFYARNIPRSRALPFNAVLLHFAVQYEREAWLSRIWHRKSSLVSRYVRRLLFKNLLHVTIVGILQTRFSIFCVAAKKQTKRINVLQLRVVNRSYPVARHFQSGNLPEFQIYTLILKFIHQ